MKKWKKRKEGVKDLDNRVADERNPFKNEAEASATYYSGKIQVLLIDRHF